MMPVKKKAPSKAAPGERVKEEMKSAPPGDSKKKGSVSGLKKQANTLAAKLTKEIGQAISGKGSKPASPSSTQPPLRPMARAGVSHLYEPNPMAPRGTRKLCKVCGKPQADATHILPRKRMAPEVDAAIAAVAKVPTDLQMTADLFGVIHCRICMADGISEVTDPHLLREKIFEIIATKGWGQTLRIMASCARLFAEVPTPLPKFSDPIKTTLHQLAVAMDSQAMAMRVVDKVAAQQEES